MKLFMFLVYVVLCYCMLYAQPKEPYLPLHNGGFTGIAVAASPDPLVAYRWNHPLATDALQVYELTPKHISVSSTTAFVLHNNQHITVNGTGDVMFDFGIESAAWLEFDSDDLADSIEMSISEYNEPAIVNAGAKNRFKTKAPVKHGNTYRLELNDELYEGVRFGWIHVKQFTKPWHIKNVRLVCQVHPVNYNGSFNCNDTMLNRIWYTGAYTVKLNMLQDFFGAILMERSDRHSWTGDAYPAQAAALAAFGNYDVIKKNIAFTANQDNGIAAYSMYWVLSLIDYFNYTGDTLFFRHYMQNAEARLTTAYNHYDSLPLLGFMGWDERLGAGFENTQAKEAQNTYRMLCIKTWKLFANALQASGDAGVAAKYNVYADEKLRKLKAATLKNFGVHAISEAIGAGLNENSNIQLLAHSIYNDNLRRLSYSPFNQYFIIQSMAAGGFYNQALATIKDNWGGQIQYGGTTFFEVFRPSWNCVLQPNDAPINNQCGYTSLAHPWSAGITKWLSEEVLGIKPLQPGFTAFSITPHLAAGLTNVKGDMPTPHGNISASFDIITGDCSVTIPEKTTAACIALPKQNELISSVMVNGKVVYQSGFKQMQDGTEDSAYVYLNNLLPGNYSIKVKYSAVKQKVVIDPQPFHYAINHFMQDSITSGNWKKAGYGKAGYALFGYDKQSSTYMKLPLYVNKVETRLNGIVIWDSLHADERSINIASAHKAKAIVTQDPNATLQTMTIDVHINDSLPHQLSLYFLDYDKQQRRSAVEIFNLDNMELAAPVQMIKNYEQGKYISFTSNSSVRIRINQVRGVNAAVSALFFD